jgi:PilZ domain
MNILIPALGIGAAILVYVTWRAKASAWMPAQAQQQFQRELRRPPRVPLVTQVQIQAHQRSLTASSKNVAIGGMLLKPSDHLSVGEPVQLSFVLPDGPAISIAAVVCRRQRDHVAVRFDVSDKQRFLVAKWVEERAAQR